MKEGIERISLPKGEVMSTLENEISQERNNAASSDDDLPAWRV